MKVEDLKIGEKYWIVRHDHYHRWGVDKLELAFIITDRDGTHTKFYEVDGGVHHEPCYDVVDLDDIFPTEPKARNAAAGVVRMCANRNLRDLKSDETL